MISRIVKYIGFAISVWIIGTIAFYAAIIYTLKQDVPAQTQAHSVPADIDPYYRKPVTGLVHYRKAK